MAFVLCLWCDEDVPTWARRSCRAHGYEGGVALSGQVPAGEALPRRVPHASLPPAAYRAIGRASVIRSSSVEGWSSDMRTLARLLGAMDQREADMRPEAA